MLDSDTKRRINTCRDILVGKVPDPKSQVEQITIALIYKFMDDMDLEAEELGFDRKFFTGEFERYRWSKLVAPGVGGQEMLNMYAEALTKMVENPDLPELFRSIFHNAYLPYRDPETLRSFLREINGFTYDHSERLGDAFEYLLSVLGSQGDAGQFRTPRHIIDFMVEIIDPHKNEVILDPACGTAGFLISAYKHILKQNTTGVVNGSSADIEGDAAEQALESPKRYKGDLLSPEERGRLARNIKGYDISPDMVRLSRVNMFLHDFKEPLVEEYDTLTSEDKWGETADVILANPPFMSPKGGIIPHSRFQVPSKRSEVLFVDYIAEHLTPNGRAAIVVPEGIIFQSQSAYVALRKTLVENHLAAVISLPAGVFNPYSGVKTSILILDRSVAKASQHIAFFKVENDGFALGAQRKAVKGSQLAKVKAELGAWLQAARGGEGDALKTPLGASVRRAKIAENGDYILNGERYVEAVPRSSRFPIVTVGEVAKVISGQSPDGETVNDIGNGVPFHQGKTDFGSRWILPPRKWTEAPTKLAEPNDILMSVRAPVGPVNLAGYRLCVGRGLAAIRATERIEPSYLFHILRASEDRIVGQSGAAFAAINRKDVEAIPVPLPPLEVQRDIVAEVECYQRVIDGARTVLDNYHPNIPVDSDWPVFDLAEIATFRSGGTPSKDNEAYWRGTIPWVSAKDLKTDLISDAQLHISELALSETATQLAPVGSILVLVRGMGLANGVPFGEVASPCAFNQDLKAIVPKADLVLPRFLAHSLRQKSEYFRRTMETAAHGTLKINSDTLRSVKIALPNLDVQQGIIDEIETEQLLVNGNHELVARFERKIDAAIARVWGAANQQEAA